MTPVDLRYVAILLNETFITALWNTGAEKSFISEEVYRKYFSYRPRQKTKDRVVTAQGAPCFHLGIDFLKESKLTLDFDQKPLSIPDNQTKQLQQMEKLVEIDLSDTKLGEWQKQKLRNLFNGFKGLFSDQPGLTHVLCHEIDSGDKGPVVSRPYRYDRVKQRIIDYHIERMLQEGTIRPIQSPYASPVVLTRKNNGLPPDSPEAYLFAIAYRKLNCKRYRENRIYNTQWHICIPQNAFRPFRGGAKFPKGQLYNIKPVIGHFVSVHMDDVIITSPSFNEYLDHLNQVFTLLRDAGLTLNKEKCHFARDKLNYLGLVISKEGIETDNSKVKAITEMKSPKNKAPVLQLPNFTEQFNQFTDARRVGIDAVLNQNHRPIAFASRTLKKAERNYTVTERECLAVIWALNKFKTYFGSLPVKQREDPELGHTYRYLENPDDDLLGPYPASRPEKYRFLLVIIDHFTKLRELIPVRKASAQAIANALFENYISRYGTPISLISDNDPQIISEVFEHLSHRLDIKHMKTVTYRPQANLTERVNHNLVHLIACFVKENHENWDRFLHEFAFALPHFSERDSK
ncbi:retrovirus-related Pol polyprotein from transposon 297 [Trichonephila clavipes]|nr:retrovirus-related Pol polyprotein from transposon 297 [Trichonephila clavipes]